MKTLIVLTFLIFSTATFGAATLAQAKSFVNTEVATMIDVLNQSLTKLSYSRCSQIGSSNFETVTGIQADGNTLTLDLEFKNTTTTYLGVQLDRRIDITVQAPYFDGVAGSVSAIIEFSCDMKKGHFLQTGVIPANPAEADVLEVFWDNTNGDYKVDFKLVGPNNGDVYFKRDSSASSFGPAVMSDNTDLIDYITNDFLITYPDSGYVIN